MIEDSDESQKPTRHFFRSLVYNYCRYCNHSQSVEFNELVDNGTCKFQCNNQNCGYGKCFAYLDAGICSCETGWGSDCGIYTFFLVPFAIYIQPIFAVFGGCIALFSTLFSCIPEVVQRIRKFSGYSLRTLCVFLVWLLTVDLFLAWIFRALEYFNRRTIYESFRLVGFTCETIAPVLASASLWAVTVLW